MNKIANALMFACMAAAAGSVVAQDAPGNGMMQPRQGNMKAVQACKDRMAKGEAAAGAAAGMKMDKKCARILKKQDMKDQAAAKKDTTDPMKK